jgi:hypothetical protein
MAAGQTRRENLAGFELSGARRRDSELRQVVICDPSFVFRIGGMARLVFDGGSRAREAVLGLDPRGVSIWLCGGASWMSSWRRRCE